MPNQTAKSWFIDVPSEAGQVLINAGRELSDFIARHLHSQVVQSGEGAVQRVILGTAGDPAVQALLGPQPLKSANGRRTRRIVKTSRGELLVVGSDERAVLDGVFALEEWLLHQLLPSECDRTWSDLFTERWQQNYGGDPAQARDDEFFRSLARLGYTHCAANAVKGWDHVYLHQLVLPRGLPVAYDKEDLADFQQQTNAMIKLMLSWGIKPFFNLCEPSGPENFSSGSKIPTSIMGRRYVPYQKKDIRTLCVQHPRVRRYYQMLIQDMLRTFSGVDAVTIYCDDGSEWFCDWNRCPRCEKKMGRVAPSIFHPMPLYIDFVNLLLEAGRRINPAFSVGLWTLHLEDQIEQNPMDLVDDLLPGVELLHCPHYWDGFLYERPSAVEWRTWRRLARTAGRRGVQLLAQDEYVITESLHAVKTLPTVEGTARKLGEYAAHGVMDLWQSHSSPTPGVHNPADLVWRLMVTGEITDPRKAVTEAVRRTYGFKTAPLMLKALRVLHAGMEAWNKDELIIDLYQRFTMGWLDKLLKVPIAPAAIEEMILGKPKMDRRIYRPEVLERAKAAEPHFERAARLAGQCANQVVRESAMSSAVLDHPLTRDHYSGFKIKETQHALRLWAALFRMMTNRLQAADLVKKASGFNHFRPPFNPPYAKAYRATASRLIDLAKADCTNIKVLANLLDALPEDREVLKFNSWTNMRLSPKLVGEDIRNTLALTQKFLKDPWPEIYKIKMERNLL